MGVRAQDSCLPSPLPATTRRHSFAGSQTARRPLHRTSKDATHGFLYASVVSPKNLTPFWCGWLSSGSIGPKDVGCGLALNLHLNRRRVDYSVHLDNSVARSLD
ncbi:unnamed protein product [Boreogadus saida]